MLSPDDSRPLGQPSSELGRRVIGVVIEMSLSAWRSVLAGGVLVSTDGEIVMRNALKGAMTVERDARHEQGQLGFPPHIYRESATDASTPSGQPRGWMDIRVGYGFTEAPHLVIECKRVHARDSTLVGKYVTEGLLRFVVGPYAPNHRAGMMFAFCLDGDCTACSQALASRIQREPSKTRLHEAWRRSTSYGQFEHLYHTVHMQTAEHAGRENAIEMLHLMLPFEP